MTNQICAGKLLKMSWSLMCNRPIARGATLFVVLAWVIGASSTPQMSSPSRTFTNDTFGFSYSYPSELAANTDDFRQKLKSAQNLRGQGAVLFSAFEQSSPGRARDAVVITAEETPPNGNAKSCLEKVTLILLKQDWTVLRENVPVKLGGRDFLRADYQRASPALFQSAVCTVLKGNSLNFVLTAGSKEDIERLFGSLKTIRFRQQDSLKTR
jgi:hypothetical protein